MSSQHPNRGNQFDPAPQGYHMLRDQRTDTQRAVTSSPPNQERQQPLSRVSTMDLNFSSQPGMGAMFETTQSRQQSHYVSTTTANVIASNDRVYGSAYSHSMSTPIGPGTIPRSLINGINGINGINDTMINGDGHNPQTSHRQDGYQSQTNSQQAPGTEPNYGYSSTAAGDTGRQTAQRTRRHRPRRTSNESESGARR